MTRSICGKHMYCFCRSGLMCSAYCHENVFAISWPPYASNGFCSDHKYNATIKLYRIVVTSSNCTMFCIAIVLVIESELTRVLEDKCVGCRGKPHNCRVRRSLDAQFGPNTYKRCASLELMQPEITQLQIK